MMNATKRYCAIILGMVLTVSLQAQTVKPDASSTIPTATSTLPPLSYLGTDKVNYVRTYDFYKALSDTTTLATELGANNVMSATQYMDGLGRPIQSVARKASGTGKDLITFMVYDQYGRPQYQPMPYVATGSSNGKLQLNPTSDQNTFLGNHYSGEDIFYSKTEFESSPLNRPTKVTGVGNSWTANDKAITTEYLVNVSAEGIRFWTLGTPSNSAAYPEGELMKTVSTDENGHQVKEYTNQKGQVVLKQVQKGSTTNPVHTDWLSTYYLYDDFGNLRYVLPPRAVELLNTHSWNWTAANIDDLVFVYTYDGRDRMVTKKVPGAGEVHMVYDKLDRLVLTQDANQRAAAENQWTFTKYDALGRPVLTGFLTESLIRDSLQARLDSWTGEMHVRTEGLDSANVIEGAIITTSNRDTAIDTYRTTTTGYIDFQGGFDTALGDSFESETSLDLSHNYVHYEGYYDATFPKLADYIGAFEVNTVSYFDNYDFTTKSWSSDYNGFYSTSLEQTDFNFVTPTMYNNVKGLATGSKVRILGTSDYLTTVMFYDDRGRVIQSQGDNHLGGADISTTQYDFAGRVLHTYTKHANPQSLANATTRILKRFTYDHAGRLITIEEKLNDTGSLKPLVSHTYNELGELQTKTLGDLINSVEILNYDYNIRGWLKSINGDYVAGADSSHYFGMDLSYDHGFTENQYNGNIAGVKWKSKSSDQTRAYGFKYDQVNRLTAADYSQGTGWTNAVSDFSTSYGYDANGNILSLMRKSTIAGTITTIDDLSYDYGSGYNTAGAGNQLKKVADAAGDLGQSDFVDGNSSGDDYQYDANGNMKDDLNKGITNITYNHLNLPETVSFGSNKTISYSYDAAGIKLQKVVNDNGSITITDYVGGFIYENNELQHFAHEEGRVRKNNAGDLVHDYFIKDHLGNTRMTLTEAPETTIYEATMEEANLAFEQQVFLNIPDPSSSDHAFLGDRSAKLGPESIGPAKLLQVSAGDEIDLSVYAKYTSAFTSTESGGSSSITSIGAALGSVFGATGAGASIYEQGTYTALSGNAGSFLASLGNNGSSTVPLAYLNYIFFDQDFNLITSASGFVQVDAGSDGAFDLIAANGLIMPEGGYLYVYLSNEGRTSDGGNVYFDAFRVTHKQGTILQEDHYYPFGMSISALSSSAPLSKPNKFKYNGFEEQTEFDLGWYDYQARFYDPQLGRFMQVDPAADLMRRHSPYNYAFDNPIRFVDPDGMMPGDVVEEGGCDPDDTCDDIKTIAGEYIGTGVDIVLRNLKAIWNVSPLGQAINAIEEGENEQPVGVVFSVTDGSGGPGPNTNGEVDDRVDVTGFAPLIGGAAKFGRYAPDGGFKPTMISDGIKLVDDGVKAVDEVKKKYGSDTNRSLSTTEPIQYTIDTAYTEGGQLLQYPAMFHESGEKMRIGLQSKDSAEFMRQTNQIKKK